MGVRIALVRLFVPIALLFLATLPAGAQDHERVGVAFGGGSARGLAHVGVIRWMEEHQVPIDLTAGTSMGGLVAGFFATGCRPPSGTAAP